MIVIPFVPCSDCERKDAELRDLRGTVQGLEAELRRLKAASSLSREGARCPDCGSRSRTTASGGACCVEELDRRRPASPSPGALDRAREERETLTGAVALIEHAWDEPPEKGACGPWCNGVHELGLCEGSVQASRIVERLRALAGDAAPAPADTEARLAAFVTKYRATGVCLLCCPEDREPWALHWQRTYPDDVTSDERGVWGASMAAVVAQAEEWEVKNDAREPQHAAAPVSPSGGAGKGDGT